ncbi:type II toxin-antitoxin system VapC family toxin [Wenzhouxiangella sp. EGI_FJ10409]|uniref:type II toxin-antitoxin system VapC family toxin n=1 Tax=Wenzhouxiangella sp. EGI_FJ10409 TaxID=3243767 RepID=UPI0035DAA8E5
MTIQAGDRIFLDTNVLLCASDSSRKQHATALELISEASASGIQLFVSGQVLREYLVVATQPISQNGLGMTPEEALGNVEQIKNRTGLAEEGRDVTERLGQLVSRHGLRGKRIHDAGIAATMASAGIEILVSENRSDFEGIEFIRILDIARAASEVLPS